MQLRKKKEKMAQISLIYENASSVRFIVRTIGN